MKICFFGTYHSDASRVQILKQGLRENNIVFFEVNASLSAKTLDQNKHLGPVQLLMRGLRKFKLITETFKNINLIRESDVLLVCFPGHLDIPFAYIIAKLFGKKLMFDPLFSMYDTYINDLKLLKENNLLARIIFMYEKIIFSLPNVILADTDFQKKYYHSIFKIPLKKIHTVYIGADDNLYKYSSEKRNKKEFYIVYYGMYNPLHGVEYIIKSAYILRNYSNLKFLFIGVGQTYMENLELAKKLNLKNVEFLTLREKEALPHLRKADVFLGFLANSPSVFKQIPNKVFQGMALGKAVITAKSPAIKNTLKHKEDIYLVNPGDENDLAKAIVDVYKNRRLRDVIAKNAYAKFKTGFTPRVVAQTLLESVN